MIPHLLKLDNTLVEEAERLDAAAYLSLNPLIAPPAPAMEPMMSTQPLSTTQAAVPLELPENPLRVPEKDTEISIKTEKPVVKKKAALGAIDPNVMVKPQNQLKKPPAPPARMKEEEKQEKEKPVAKSNVVEAIMCLSATLDDAALCDALERLQGVAVARGLRVKEDHIRARPAVGRHEAQTDDVIDVVVEPNKSGLGTMLGPLRNLY